MFKRSFFASEPRFEYETIGDSPVESVQIPVPDKVTLFVKKPKTDAAVALKVGDRVKTGQKLAAYPADPNAYAVSSVTGVISSIAPYAGDFGQSYTAVTIQTDREEERDAAFAEILKEGVEAARDYLACLPGDPIPNPNGGGAHYDTLIICGVEKDLLIRTNQYVMRSNIRFMNSGISLLKKLTGIHKTVLALPESLIKHAGGIGGASGVEIRAISTVYPSSLPRLIMNDIMSKPVPANKTCEDLGILFVSAEAVASIGKAVEEQRLPVTKTFTFIRKDLSSVMVEARVGTPLSDVFKELDITLYDKDRIIVGGPMTGSAVYSEEHPVLADTDAVMIQDSAEIPMVSNTPCINCGECVRACPADIPVDMLIRFLEARQYEDAADLYDLYSCVECGLCSFVCVSKIPIFQYIKLAKHELDRIRSEEEASDV